ERGFMPTPCVVEQVGTRCRDFAADLGAPRVDANDQRRVLFPYQRDEIRNTLDLLHGVDVWAWPRFDAANVDDVRAIGDRAVDGGQCCVGRKSRALIEE